MSIVTISVDLQDPKKREQLFLAVAAIVGSDAAAPVPVQIDAAEPAAKPAKKTKKAAPAAEQPAEEPAPIDEGPVPDMTEDELKTLSRKFAADHGADKLQAVLALFNVKKSIELPRAEGGRAVREAMARVTGAAA